MRTLQPLITSLFLLAASIVSAVTPGGPPLAALGLPAAPRALAYPLDARRDQHPFDPGDLVSFAATHGLNLLVVGVAPGPALDDARALQKAAAAAHLALAWAPVDSAPAAVTALAAQLDKPAAWVLPAAATDAAKALRAAQPGVALIGSGAIDRGDTIDDTTDLAQLTPDSTAKPTTGGATLRGVFDVLLYDTSILWQPGTRFSAWARGLDNLRASFGGPVLAQVECAPPDWFIAAGCMRNAAPQADLYTTARLRPESVLTYGGDTLLAPSAAQMRLATYAALCAGARGIVFSGAGHLMGDGAEPRGNANRANELALLCAELTDFEPFMAAGEAGDGPQTMAGLSGGALVLGPRRLVLLYRDDVSAPCQVAGDTFTDLRLEAPCFPDPQRLDIIRPGEITPGPIDIRENGVRLPVAEMDLTSALALGPNDGEHAAWLKTCAERSAADLPMTATRAQLVAMSEYAKVTAELAAVAKSQSIDRANGQLQGAHRCLESAQLAASFGYQLTALDQALEAERLVRSAAMIQLRAADQIELAAEQPSWARLSLATLPALWSPPRDPQVGPLPLPLSQLGKDGVDGEIPTHWTATPGFDQTVATLRYAGSRLAWTPAGADPGALYLSFTPGDALTGSLTCTWPAAPKSPRMFVLAAAAGAVPLAGIVWQPNGAITLLPGGAKLGEIHAGQAQKLSFTLAAGQLTWSLDGAAGPAIAVNGPVGALALAKHAGADDATLQIDNVSVEATK